MFKKSDFKDFKFNGLTFKIPKDYEASQKRIVAVMPNLEIIEDSEGKVVLIFQAGAQVTSQFPNIDKFDTVKKVNGMGLKAAKAHGGLSDDDGINYMFKVNGKWFSIWINQVLDPISSDLINNILKDIK
ncbi:MAG: hypothetical protein FWH29_00585 [Methanobrevibacter sp.]|nr:hypothetical protein [Methanobrevibacter sp.]